jgi:hypothetical protein
MSGKVIPKARLEAIPWARYTVECQSKVEKESKGRNRWNSTPQFMDNTDLAEDEDEESDEEETKPKAAKE